MAKEVDNRQSIIRYEGEDIFRRVTKCTSVARRISEPEGATDFSKIGAQLRILGREFEESEQGRKAREIIQTMDLNQLRAKSLREIASEIFADGINGYSLTVFFAFCKELMKRCWKFAENLGRQLYVWTTDFIFEGICPWVEDHGGWGKVLGIIAGALGLTAVVGMFLVLLL